MSTTITLPDFYDLEIVTAEKMQALVDALNSKFAAGTGSADIMWPLTAGGNLDMGVNATGYSILNGKMIMGIVNAASYPTLQDAVDAAGADGSVFVPPGTTVDASGVELTNSNITIYGAGPSSVIRLTTDATAGSLLRTPAEASRTSGIRIHDLTIDGNSGTGTDQHGLLLQYVDDVIIERVVFDDFSGDCVRVINNGAAGSYSKSVLVNECVFLDGDGKHVFSNDVVLLEIRTCIFDSFTEEAVYCHPDTGASYMNDVSVRDCYFTSGASSCVYVVGHATESALAARIDVSGNSMNSITGTDNTIQLGIVSHILRDIFVIGNKLRAAPVNAIEAYAEGGHITNNIFADTVGIGINLEDATTIMVANNCCMGGTGYGIDASGATDCSIHGNELTDNTAGALLLAGNSGCEFFDNIGVAVNRPLSHGWFAENPITVGSNTIAYGGTVTFDANTLSIGSTIKVECYCTDSGETGTNSYNVTINWEGASYLDGIFWKTDTAQANGCMVRAHLTVVDSTTIHGSMFVTAATHSHEDSNDTIDLGGLDFTASNTMSMSVRAPASGASNMQNLYVTVDQYEVL